jgi:protein-disulfide isomerase
MRALIVGAALLLCAGTAVAAEVAARSALDKPTLESYVRYLLMWGPQITVSVSDPRPSEVPGLQEVTLRGTAGAASAEMVLQVSEDGRKIVQGNIFDIARNPFQNDLDRISTYMQPSMGPSGAPVTMVVFTDFQCAYCRLEAEMLRRQLPQALPDQVRLYYKDFPLESIHPVSKELAIAGRCVYNQSGDAFWAYHDWAFSQQQAITEENLRSKLLEFAEQQGNLDTLKLGRCFDERQTEKDVDASVAEARALNLNATPTLFVNGRKFEGQVPWENLQQIIQFELENGDLLGADEEEDCCTVELPTPLNR